MERECLNCGLNISERRSNVKYCCTECKNKYKGKTYYLSNKKERLLYKKNYYYNNIDKIKEYNDKYRRENLEYYKNYQINYNYSYDSNAYNKKRRENDPLYRLTQNLRNLIKNAFLRKYTNKSLKTIDILGCDFLFFQEYIQNMFDENMNWENYGSYWEIDHIIPSSSGKTSYEIIKLNHYLNLRPLKVEENREKGNKY